MPSSTACPACCIFMMKKDYLRRWNKSHETMTGYTKEELDGMHILDWFKHDEKEPAAIKAAVEKAFSEGHANAEGKLMIKSGEKIPYYFTARLLEIKGKKYMTGIGINISERKQAEKTLIENEMRLSSIVRNMPGVVYQFYASNSGEWSVRYGVERMKEFFGLPADQTTLFPAFLSHIHEEDRQKFKASIQKAVDTFTPWNFESRFVKPSGEMIWFHGLATPIRHEDHLVFEGILLDITDRKQAEEERQKLQTQLLGAHKLESIGRLAGGVAHDFNNILTGIQGNASLMMMEYNPEHPHYSRLSRIEEHVKRGANLTKQLLGFARGGKYEVKIISVNDVVRKISQIFVETRKEIEVDFQLEDALYSVEADAGQIEQVLLNIFINAGHAMSSGGYLHIQTSNIRLEEADAGTFEVEPGDYVKISITDTGYGMDSETIRQIFEPFFTTKAEEGGSGLGLASAYGIIRNHGGIINVQSKPGQGSTFNIYIPSSEKKIEKEEDQVSDRGLLSGSGGLLLIDDEPMILSTTSEMLRILGYTVYQAASGQEAVSIYLEKKDKIDLVILDMILPGMTGSQVLKMLQDINPDVKIILSSGYIMHGEVQKVMEAGCCGFIQKPYRYSELSSIVHRILYPVQP